MTNQKRNRGLLCAAIALSMLLPGPALSELPVDWDGRLESLTPEECLALTEEEQAELGIVVLPDGLWEPLATPATSPETAMPGDAGESPSPTAVTEPEAGNAEAGSAEASPSAQPLATPAPSPGTAMPGDAGESPSPTAVTEPGAGNAGAGNAEASPTAHPLATPATSPETAMPGDAGESPSPTAVTEPEAGNAGAGSAEASPTAQPLATPATRPETAMPEGAGESPSPTAVTEPEAGNAEAGNAEAGSAEASPTAQPLATPATSPGTAMPGDAGESPTAVTEPEAGNAEAGSAEALPSVQPEETPAPSSLDQLTEEAEPETPEATGPVPDETDGAGGETAAPPSSLDQLAGEAEADGLWSEGLEIQFSDAPKLRYAYDGARGASSPLPLEQEVMEVYLVNGSGRETAPLVLTPDEWEREDTLGGFRVACETEVEEGFVLAAGERRLIARLRYTLTGREAIPATPVEEALTLSFSLTLCKPPEASPLETAIAP